MKNLIAKLEKKAASQYGYFTAAQATQLGFIRNNLTRYAGVNLWLQLGNGLFRMPGYTDSMAADFCRLSLWSRDRQGRPQAVISHESALRFYCLSDSSESDDLCFSVPLRFQKEIPAGCRPVLRDLARVAYSEYGAFRVTSVKQTIRDMEKKLRREKRLEKVLECALLGGLLLEEDVMPYNAELPHLALTRAVSTATVASERRVMLPGLGRRESFRRHAGFTLVELLVVVAIISILCSLLMPMLQKARATARKLVCASNLKQISTATYMYIDDNRGYMPTDEPGNPNPTTSNYLFGPVTEPAFHYTTLCPYIGYGPNTYSECIDHTVPPAPISRCPEGGRDGTNNPRRDSGNPNYSYHFNTFLAPKIGSSSRYQKPATAKNPSGRIFFADVNYSAFYSITHFEPRHSGGANFMFLDQHIKYYNPAELAAVKPYIPYGGLGFWYDD
jgi:prepilin-type N-terminal cleavage/methylation domain-containing protein/prepilin-type processing-associated H-X9-DG protein